jgi:prepilin-type N-terminal cleavage/methylation domain-containing protein
MIRHKTQPAGAQQGFTIVELMIATAVLSTILVLVSSVMISIGNLYTKGINQARVQDNVRSITDQISQDVQLNNGSVVTGAGTVTMGSQTPNVKSICIGSSIRYSFIIGYKIGPVTDSEPAPYNAQSHIPSVLWRDDNGYNDPTGTNMANTTGVAAYNKDCQVVDLTKISTAVDTITGKPVDPSGAELIAPNTRLTEFGVTGSGPYDVSVGVAYGDIDLLTITDPTLMTPGSTVGCQGSVGDQFCATDNLHTSVVQRL